jgi:hypothetical protein
MRTPHSTANKRGVKCSLAKRVIRRLPRMAKLSAVWDDFAVSARFSVVPPGLAHLSRRNQGLKPLAIVGPSLRDAAEGVPGVKTPGYCRAVPCGTFEPHFYSPQERLLGRSGSALSLILHHPSDLTGLKRLCENAQERPRTPKNAQERPRRDKRNKRDLKDEKTTILTPS